MDPTSKQRDHSGAASQASVLARPDGDAPWVVFETARLRGRRWVAGDLGPLFEVYGDPETVRYVGDGSPITMAQCEAWLEVTAANYARRGYGMFTLEDRQTGEVVGFCGLVHPGGQEEPEIKYALRRARWGAGLAGEFIPALLEYGARVHGLRQVIATVHPENLASRRVLERAGLVVREVLTDEDGGRTVVFVWGRG